MACALASDRACDVGDIRERNSENFLAIDQPFLSKLIQVNVIDPVRNRDIYLVPPIIAGLVAANRGNTVSATRLLAFTPEYWK